MKSFDILKKLSQVYQIQQEITDRKSTEKAQEETKHLRFVKLVLNGLDEKEIFKKLYPNGGNRDRLSFNKLKTRLIEKLTTTIIIHNSPSKDSNKLQKSESFIKPPVET